MLSRLLASIVFLASSAAISIGAEIVMHEKAGQTVVTVTGRLNDYDARVFLSMTANVRSGTVVLNGNGGSLYAGVTIGKAIRRLGLATMVSSKVGACLSSCAFAWLGGMPRQLDERARIGFHSVYMLEGGRPVISPTGNALAGAYMRDIQLSDAVIVWATEERPPAVKWLTKDDARKTGLMVDYVDGQSNVIETVPDPFLPKGQVPIPQLSESPG